jgi:acyl-coenzyme A synthetase/AMP-(fatty) acid ligase
MWFIGHRSEANTSGYKASIDEDGYIRLLDGLMMCSRGAGHRISNAEVEASAEKHPAVVAAASSASRTM